MYHKINRPQSVNILEKRNKGKVFTIKEIDEKIENLHKLLNEIDNTIPCKKVPTNNLGLNKNTRELIQQRRKVTNLARKNKNNQGLKTRINELNKEIKKGINDVRRSNWDYINKRVRDKNATKKNWNTLKKI